MEGPHGPGYRLAGSPVYCRQLEADAGTILLKGVAMLSVK